MHVLRIEDYRSVRNEKRTKQEKIRLQKDDIRSYMPIINNALANSMGRDTEKTKYPEEGMKIGWQMPHPGDRLQSAHGADQTENSSIRTHCRVDKNGRVMPLSGF